VALYFLDTSALVKLYVREQGSDRMVALAAAAAGNRIAILSFAQVEFRSALRRRQKAGDIPSGTADQLLDIFQLHVESRFSAQPVTDYMLDVACQLTDRYFLRALDAIQLAGYVNLRNSAVSEAPFFVSGDRELLAAATLEGAPVLDPSS